MKEWTNREIERLRRVYPHLTTEEAAKLFPGRTLAAIRRRAHLEGVATHPKRVSKYMVAAARWKPAVYF